ncbi:MAG: class I SAM-dependent methyltransferase, partial [Patescibacteria group bacterium]
MSALSITKRFLLTHEPFKPMHVGTWVRGVYFRHYIQKYVPLSLIQNALDGACGNGQYAHLIAMLAPQARVKGVDLIEGKNWSGFAMPNITFSQMDLCDLSEKNEEDFIVSIDTIEHIVHNENVLQKFFEALRPGGVLYLAVPCEGDNWRFFPRSWFKRFHEWEEHEHIGEQRTIKELVAVLEQLGFKILLARNTFTFWGTIVW